MVPILGGTVCRGVQVFVGLHDELSADGVLVDVGAAGFEFGAGEDEVVGEASLPDGELRAKTAGKAPFDQVHDTRDGLVLSRQEQVYVIRHNDKRVESVSAFGAVSLEGFQEEVCVARHLEDPTAIVGNGCDEEGALGGGSLRDCHWGEV